MDNINMQFLPNECLQKEKNDEKKHGGKSPSSIKFTGEASMIRMGTGMEIWKASFINWTTSNSWASMSSG